jgi:hypothetical protein
MTQPPPQQPGPPGQYQPGQYQPAQYQQPAPQPPAQQYQQPPAQQYQQPVQTNPYGAPPGHYQQQSQQRDVPVDDWDSPLGAQIPNAPNQVDVDRDFWMNIPLSNGRGDDPYPLVQGTHEALITHTAKKHDTDRDGNPRGDGKLLSIVVGMQTQNGPRKVWVDVSRERMPGRWNSIMKACAPELHAKASAGEKFTFKHWFLKGRRFYAVIDYGRKGSKYAADGEDPRLGVEQFLPLTQGQALPGQQQAPQQQSMFPPQGQPQPQPPAQGYTSPQGTFTGHYQTAPQAPQPHLQPPAPQPPVPQPPVQYPPQHPLAAPAQGMAQQPPVQGQQPYQQPGYQPHMPPVAGKTYGGHPQAHQQGQAADGISDDDLPF